MNRASLKQSSGYTSTLRDEQKRQTRERIERAAAALLEGGGDAEAITFKAVAERAGVTEMTVYRHFPTRDDLLKGLWSHLNREMAERIGMPESAQGLLAQHAQLFAGFDRIAPQIVASITTAQGREMRAALNETRRKAFLKIVDGLAPGLPAARRTHAAAVLQLLHSAHAWLSLREQWALDGAEAGEATRWAIEVLIRSLRRSS